MEWESRGYCDDLHTPFEPVWRTPDVLMLGQGIYDQHAFERMPILADALQDAGCDHPELIRHLQQDGDELTAADWVLWNLLGYGK